MSRIEVRDVSYSVGVKQLLRDIHLTGDDGEFIGIIGPNGSGKTTLLKTITRVLQPDGGTILLDDRDIKSFENKELARKMAHLAQNNSIEFQFSALDIVLMGRTPHLGRFQWEGPLDREVAERSMHLTNTWHLRDQHINTLSGGELQRVILARALAQEPKILLLDEPTSHLDINHELEILELLKVLASRGLTIIAVIHDLNQAAHYCDKLVLLHDGAVLDWGAPIKVLTSENIQHAFNTRAMIQRHPLTGSVYLTIMPDNRKDQMGRLYVHVICGGGSGSQLMYQLHEMGYQVSVGVLNAIDTDYETANRLGLEVVSEAPFSPITPAAHQRNLELIKDADLVVLTDVPWGRGNILNLEAAEISVEKLIVIEGGNDFTGGTATNILHRLQDKTLNVSNTREAIEEIERRSNSIS